MISHSERALYEHQHQGFRRSEGGNPLGLVLFRAIVAMLEAFSVQAEWLKKHTRDDVSAHND